MRQLRSRLVGLGTVAAASVALACSGGTDATGPLANEPAIPLFRTQGTCVEWSCQTNICGNDTALYGACCTHVDPGATPVAKPSCNTTAGAGMPGYCGENPYQACLDRNLTLKASGTMTDCSQTAYSQFDGTDIGNITTAQDSPWDGAPYFPECNPGQTP